jgi:hypothetical protein
MAYSQRTYLTLPTSGKLAIKVVGDTGGSQILVKVFFEVVMTHGPHAPCRLFMQAHPPVRLAQTQQSRTWAGFTSRM